MRSPLTKFILLTLFFFAAGNFITIKAQKISMNGTWEIVKDSEGSIKSKNIESVSNWRKCIIPHSWHLEFDDMMDYQGIVWYKKGFSLEDKNENKRYILHFGAVDYLAQLFVNKKYVDQHEGGYTPFNYDITDFILKGENEILLRVVDPEMENGTDGILYKNIPFGKQNWYVQNSGIWQDVFLEIKDVNFISNVRITTSNSGKVNVLIKLDQKALRQSESIKLSLISPEEEIVYLLTKVVEGAEVDFEFNLENPRLWDPDNPNLYTCKIEYGGDVYKDNFGFKEFTKEKGKFFLNGKPFYMIGALDQNFYPETMYLIPSEDYVRDEMMKAKALGLNTLRCHIKIPDPVYLKVADEVGLIIWYEVPNWETLNPEAMSRCRVTIDEMLERDWNHPSLSVISVINESWGVNLQNEIDRQWMKNEFNYIKSKAVGRLVVDNSACFENFHVKSDINDYHTYWSIPDDYKNFSTTVADVASRPDWLFSTFGDAEQTGDEVMMISEFGNWGLPKLPQNLPFWFDRKFFDIDVVMPAGVHQRFLDYNFSRFHNSFNDLAEESQTAQFRALKYEIEEIRLHDAIQGYIITEFTDINWESNGLLDMWRNFKVYKDELNSIQQPDLIIPRTDKFNYLSGDTIQISLFLSHYSDIKLDGAKIKLNIPDFYQREISLPSIPSGRVKGLGEIEFPLPEVHEPVKQIIEMELITNSNQIISKNYAEVFVFPAVNKIHNKVVSLHPSVDKNEIKLSLVRNGFEVNGVGKPGQIIITKTIDDSILSKIKEGAYIILEADSTTLLPKGFPLKVESRYDNWYDGSWATNMNWLNTNCDIFKKLKSGKTLGFEGTSAMPGFVITNIESNYFDDVHAGIFIGWMHMNAGYLVQMKSGNSKIIITTFRLSENYSTDPFARMMLNNIIEYILGDNCSPKIEWNQN